MSCSRSRDPEEIRGVVREQYGAAALGAKGIILGGGCCPSDPDKAKVTPPSAPKSCCTDASHDLDYAKSLGYSGSDLNSVPEGSNMGLGCGNPVALSKIQPGETVLDLGSGAGFDSFLASRRVGPNGQVIGVDMTPEMIARARKNATKSKSSSIYSNISFRLGELEYLPVGDRIVDLIISNCVLNLVPDKKKVFLEMGRVLKPGGRICISDILRNGDLSPEAAQDLDLYVGCVAGACHVGEVTEYLKEAGFENIEIRRKEGSDELIRSWVPGQGIEATVFSGVIEAVKN